MDKETETWYEEQFLMFSCQGWKDLMQQAGELIKNYENVRNISDNDRLHYRKGQLDILDWLSGWQKTVDEQYKVLTNEQNHP